MHISFRPLTKEDYPQFAYWLGQPHVAKWWREPATVEYVREHYGSDPKTSIYVALGNDKPMGIIQSYFVDDYEAHATSVNMKGAVGVDLFIGEADLIGKGYGSVMLMNFVDQIIRKKYPSATGVIADPEVANNASIRAFEKAGFTKGSVVGGEYGPEQLMILRFEK